MNNQLHHINMQDWPERARQANWCADTLAKDCGVSLRTLQRYFLKNMGKSPKKWLLKQRGQLADKFRKDGLSVKQMAANLGYEHFNNFSRDYKEHTGYCPTDKTAPIRPPNP